MPYAIDFTVPAREKLCATITGRTLHERLRNDLLLTPVLRVEWGIRDAAGYYRDEYGLLWDRRIDAYIGMPQPARLVHPLGDRGERKG